ncbi:hypothetical protein GGI19_004860 [Coemansia pectinata]|uniref:Mitochondrial ATP synthase epsilon chain-domain-containing protein n=1 Tax=Coemansia pectinata TaxID=1052879 RepID=A0A9W8GRD6_9FUNG|nr:hypothetical protein GGI19_004860 [Coemansia pectinata]
MLPNYLYTANNNNYSYLQYSSIAARALRRVAKTELQAEIAKREGLAVKYAKWDSGKAGVSAAIPNVETRPKADN